MDTKNTTTDMKREGEPDAGGVCKKHKNTVTVTTQPAPEKTWTMDDFPESPHHTVITHVDMSAAPTSRQYCELTRNLMNGDTRNLMEGKDELICFLMMLEEKVGRVHLTFNSDETNYDEQFKDHVKEAFAANDLPPFDFKACVAWPRICRQLCLVISHIVNQLDAHPFSKSLKIPTRATTPGGMHFAGPEQAKPWPSFHDCTVKWNMHWAIVVCSKDE